MIRASIDIGSNSVLLLCADFDLNSQKIVKEIYNESFVTSLGKDLDKNKVFLETSMQATCEALEEYKRLLEKISFDCQHVLVTATEASRVALNAKDFFSKIKKDYGFHITTISGDGEAYYTAYGVASGLDGHENSVVIMDVGGASTELIKLGTKQFNILNSISLAVGSVRASDWKTENIFESKISDLFKIDIGEYRTNNLICVAGSMTALASMYKGQKVFDDKSIDGLKISFNDFKDFVNDLEKTNIENLLLLFPFLGKRAPFVAAGARVAEIFGTTLGIETMTISTRGLRYGTLCKGVIDDKFICN